MDKKRIRVHLDSSINYFIMLKLIDWFKITTNGEAGFGAGHSWYYGTLDDIKAFFKHLKEEDIKLIEEPILVKPVESYGDVLNLFNDLFT